MLNGSPRKEGCTYIALIQIAGVLEKNGIESEIFQAGTPELENVRAAAYFKRFQRRGNEDTL